MQKTLRERNVDEEFEMLMNLVFGREKLSEGFSHYSPPPPKHKRCPRCHEDKAEIDLNVIEWRRKELKALRILAERTERGEKFSHERPNDDRPSTVLRNRPLPKKKALKSKKSNQSQVPKKTVTKSEKSNQSLSEQLSQLAALRESGALTAREFKLAKGRLLGTS